jgi:hypothetical protein
MPSNVKANLLHDGIVDTLVSVGASERPGLPGVIVAAAATIGNVPRMARLLNLRLIRRDNRGSVLSGRQPDGLAIKS